MTYDKTEAERGLIVAAGILKLVAERDMARKCEEEANLDYYATTARQSKLIDDYQKVGEDEYERAKKLETALLELVRCCQTVEQYPSINEECRVVLDRCHSLCQELNED